MTLTLFDIPDHKHNNDESDKQFKEHKGHFNNQCQVVYDYLMDGGNLDVIKAMTELRIVDLRRRIADLKEQGVNITDDKIQGGHGAKFWYMTFADKFHNKQKFNK